MTTAPPADPPPADPTGLGLADPLAGGLVPTSGAGVLTRPLPPLLHDALSALDADLGARCVGWGPPPAIPGRTTGPAPEHSPGQTPYRDRDLGRGEREGVSDPAPNTNPSAGGRPGPGAEEHRTAAGAAAGGGSTVGGGRAGRAPGKVRRYRRRLDLLGEAIDPRTLPVVLRWLGSAHRGSAATRRGYCDDLLSVWAPLTRELGHQRFALGQLTTAHLELWQLRMTRAGAAPRTINRYTATLSSLYRYAAGVLDPPPRNPVTEDVRPPVDQSDAATATPILEPDEVAAVARQATGLAELVLIALLYILAGRVTEICAADAADLHTRGRRSYLRVRRKGGQVRDLEVPPALAELLDRHLDGRADGPLLLDRSGRRLDRHGALRISAALGRAAGVLEGRALTPHVWRASRITHMLDALHRQSGDQGVMAGLAQVMTFANHKRSETTLRYWVRRSHGERNAQLAATGEQVLADLLRDWLTTATPDTATAVTTLTTPP
ncbi:tyrosine-type recombinase/integrase [Actinomadura sp. 3N407]|uniref:tyrosine-type recombinase/integrase n=1 Tax=Actinomadura sp. 3N407 TaxID=3457423 RepID=UPI003FCD6B51